MTIPVPIERSSHPPGEGWRRRGGCRGYPVGLFFPVGARDPQAEVAKSVCLGCPVQAPCLEFAVATNEEYGVWGGTTEAERRPLRRRRQGKRRQAS